MSKTKQANPLQISERDFERQVKQLAQMFGWLYYHTWRSIHSPAGYPDCCMVKGTRILFAELKSEKGVLSDKQQEWINALSDAGKAEVYVWRPSNLEIIAEVLR